MGDVLFVHGGISLEAASRYQSLEKLNADYHSLPSISIDGILGADGPLWFRGYARSDPATCTELRKVLALYGVGYMVIGHTVKDKITVLCGKAVLIDTGSSYAMMGHPSALEIVQRNGVTVRMRAVYQGLEEGLFDFTGVDAGLGRVEG